MSVICTECQFSNQSDAKVCRKCKFPFDGEWPQLVGRTIGNYKLVRRVGGGGFGAVYHARHVTLGNSFAVKILHPKLAQEDQSIEQFQQEAHVLAELKHENVVQVIDFGFLEEVGFYLITEWLEGRNLYRIWRRHTNIDRGWLLALFSQLLDALSYAHERGIVHRDLKPENLMLVKGARNRILLKIVDFGIAKLVEQSAKKQSEAEGETRRSAMAVGTPYYMAPEQVQGLVDFIGPQTDLYACGIILSELLTGQRVFEGNEQRETMRLHLDAYPPRLEELHPDGVFSDPLNAVVQRSLAKRPTERFRDAHDFYEQLETAMRELEIEPVWEDIYEVNEPLTRKPLPKRPRPPIEYRRVRADDGGSPLPGIVLGVVFLLAVLGGGFVFLQTQQRKANKNRVIRRAPLKRAVDKGWGNVTRPTPQRRTILPIPAPLPVPGSDAGTRSAPPKRGTRATPKRRRVIRRRAVRRRAPERRAPERRAPERRAPERRAPAVMLSLNIHTKPAGGRIFVDKRFVGKTPLTIRAPKGKLVKVRVKMDGKVDYRYTWRATKSRKIFHRFIEDL